VASEHEMQDHLKAWNFAMSELETAQAKVEKAKEDGKRVKELETELEKVQKTLQKVKSRNGGEPRLDDLFNMAETTTIKGVPAGKKSQPAGKGGAKVKNILPEPAVIEPLAASKQRPPSKWKKSNVPTTPEPAETTNNGDDDDDEPQPTKKAKYDYKTSKNKEEDNDWRTAARKRLRSYEQEMADERGMDLEEDEARSAISAQLSRTPRAVPYFHKSSFEGKQRLEDGETRGLGDAPMRETRAIDAATFKPEEPSAKRARWMKTNGDPRRNV